MVITATDLTRTLGESSLRETAVRFLPESFQKGVSPSLLDPSDRAPTNLQSAIPHRARVFFGPYWEVMLNFLTVIARSESILRTLPGIPRYLQRVKIE